MKCGIVALTSYKPRTVVTIKLLLQFVIAITIK